LEEKQFMKKVRFWIFQISREFPSTSECRWMVTFSKFSIIFNLALLLLIS
jgi:hypothetical protein